MDPKNLFHTPTTYRLIRLEYLFCLLVCTVLAIMHFGQIRWLVFAALFVYIDAVGYLPGVIAHKRRGIAYLPRTYYVLYNTMHSLATAGMVAGLWCLFVRPEWALLALPLHLFGDRALFGNFYKSFGIEFEPKGHPDYVALKALLDHPRRVAPAEPTTVAPPSFETSRVG
jgi:hypothetical protein